MLNYKTILVLTSFLFIQKASCAPLASPVSQTRSASVGKISAQDFLNTRISQPSVEQLSEESLPDKLFADISANEIRFSQEQNYYEAIGDAEVYLPDREAMLYADRITYDTDKKLIEAFGNIRVTQKDNEVLGEYASFDASGNTFHLDDPNLFLSGVRLKAKKLDSKYYKKKDESYSILQFQNGVAALEEPIIVYEHATPINTLYSREVNRHQKNRKIDWDDLSDKSSLRYSAKHIKIDNTRKTNNLKINGARVWLNKHLSVPSPFHITTTIGEGSQTRFKGPVIGNRQRLGGFLLGPRLYREADYGIFSIVPLLQIGDGPEFGAGLITTFNTPEDKTALMAGYGSLDNRFIASAHQDVYRKLLQADALVNQFKRNSIFGVSQVGQLYELSSQFRVHLPFIEERGANINISGGWAKDNNELFTNERLDDLANEREGTGFNRAEEHSGFRSEIQGQAYSQPIWRRGNELYNVAIRTRAQGAFRFYDTGDVNTIARFGPALQVRVDNLAFELDYLFAAIGGESPFLFDQFVDGSQSVVFDGDYKVNKWFSVGTVLTYNIGRDRFVRNAIRAEIGPQDFKVRLGYDVVRNQFDLGFNVLFGEPLRYDNLDVRI